MIPTQWPIARVVDTHQGRDGLVCVVTLKTKKWSVHQACNESRSAITM